MKIPQLSLFLENRPGQLGHPCRELANAGINILTLSLADTQQFGILRLIVRDWKRAKEVLEGAGHVVNVTDVVAIEVPDRPGGMAELMEALESASINIEYMYAFNYRRGNDAAVVIRFDDPDAALAILQKAGFKIVSSTEVFDNMAG
ncbi:MAG: amino acid-binding protein [Candidatus Sumerlaeaceae bacterium]|nr:amino acid-binding protein [Candidatus Sumerlaeaceae bacterium]